MFYYLSPKYTTLRNYTSRCKEICESKHSSEIDLIEAEILLQQILVYLLVGFQEQAEDNPVHLQKIVMMKISSYRDNGKNASKA